MNEYTEFDTAAEMQKALDRKKAAYGVPYAPLLETTVVDADGIIRDCPHNDLRTESGDCACGCRDIQVCSECGEEQEMAVNALIGRDERPSFQPSTAELAMFLIFFFAALTLGIHTVMKGDLAAVRAESFVGNGAIGR